MEDSMMLRLVLRGRKGLGRPPEGGVGCEMWII